MARVIGGPALSGTIGNMVFYQMNGKTYCKQKAYISPSSIKKSPTRRQQRETMSEFGKASHIGKVIRQEWWFNQAKAMGNDISGKLTARIVPIIRNSTGFPGQRSTQISKHGETLKGFEFQEGRNPNAHFSHVPTVISTDAENCNRESLEKQEIMSKSSTPDTPNTHAHTPTHSENKVSLHFPPKTRHNAKLAHKEATHYIIHLNALQIPDYHTDPNNPKCQHPTDQKQFPESANAQSDPIPLGQHPGADGTLSLTLPKRNNDETTLIISYGIEYVTQQGDKYNHIKISKPRARKRQYDAYMTVLEVIPTKTTKPAERRNSAKGDKNPKQSAERGNSTEGDISAQHRGWQENLFPATQKHENIKPHHHPKIAPSGQHPPT